jgi:hypothetical protein
MPFSLFAPAKAVALLRRGGFRLPVAVLERY